MSKAYGALPAGPALADDPAVERLNLTTAKGLRGFLAATLAALGKIPFDSRTAHAISAIATAQKNILDIESFEHRLAALEKAETVEGHQRLSRPFS